MSDPVRPRPATLSAPSIGQTRTGDGHGQGQGIHPCPAPKCRGDALGNATLGTTPMCDHHTAKVGQAITELPGLYVDLHLAMARAGASGDDPHVTVSNAPPLPLSVQARSLQEDMLAVVAEAEVSYRASKGWPTAWARRRGRELPLLTARCRWLTRHVAGVLALDVALGVRILVIKHSTRILLGETRLVHRLAAPCPECDCVGLVRENGSSYVECRACGCAFPEKNYGLLAKTASADMTAPAQPRPGKVESAADGYGW